MADGTTCCLWIVTKRSIYGISLLKLMELGKNEEEVDWNSISPIPSDFDLNNLPEHLLHPFVYDSKIFLASGHGGNTFTSNIYQLSFQDDDNSNSNSTRTKPLLAATAAAPSSIPPIPVTVHTEPTFVNIGAKVYLLACDRWPEWNVGFCVLDPAIRDWKQLQLPLSPTDKRVYYPPEIFAALQGKLFIRYLIRSENGYHRPHLYCLDDQSEEWDELGEDKLQDHLLIGSVSVPLSRPDQMVALSYHAIAGGRVQLYAMLFDCKDNNYSVVCYQDLEGLSMQLHSDSKSYDGFVGADLDADVMLVDLGNGLVCALVSGTPNPDLGVLVFTLTLQEPDTTGAPPSPSPSPGKEERTFLNVKTHVNRVFSLPDYFDDDYPSYSSPDKLHHAFLAPSTFLHKYDGYYAYSKGTTYPPRKQQKLASGTYPS